MSAPQHAFTAACKIQCSRCEDIHRGARYQPTARQCYARHAVLKMVRRAQRYASESAAQRAYREQPEARKTIPNAFFFFF